MHAPAANDCSACHQPHASDQEPLLRAAIPALCFTCHTELGERLVTETAHQPAGEPDGCLGCHGSHVTPQRNLLLVGESATCGQCHEIDGSEFTADHLGFSGEDLECGSCHDPHASLMAGLLHPLQHEPFAAGDCSACHDAVEEPSGGAQ
jgi:predicted CXXCH cytochrome family protein